MEYNCNIKNIINLTNFTRYRYGPVAIILAFCTLGIAILGVSRASIATSTIEAETSTSRTGGVTSFVNPQASNKSAIKFGLEPPNSSNYMARAVPTNFVNPIHFLDAYASHIVPFNRIETDVVIEVENGSDGYYISSFLFFPNTPACSPNCYAYMGLQTVGGRGLPPGGSVDKMAIFSVWNSTSSIPAAGVTAVNFDGEGTGKSLRIAYPWQVGKTYRLIMGNDPGRSTLSTSYWAASVLDVATGQVTNLGSILMPTGMTQASSSVAFHERYSGQTTDCSQMSPSQVKFSNIRSYSPELNGGTWAKINSWVIYQADVVGCNARFWAKDLPGAAIRSGINTPPQ